MLRPVSLLLAERELAIFGVRQAEATDAGQVLTAEGERDVLDAQQGVRAPLHPQPNLPRSVEEVRLDVLGA